MDRTDLTLLDALAALLRRGERGALATVVRTGGSTPRRAGARLLLDAQGTQVGTIGGGHVEAKVLEALAACLAGGRARTLTFELDRDLGMCCGGRMEVFVEPVQGSPRLIVFGAGHVAHATARLAAPLGFRVCIVDEREELNSAARFPEAERHLLAPDEALRELAPSEHDFVLITTHDHALDREALEAALAHPHRYIGMIGSKRKVHRIYERVRERRGDVAFERVFAPVGLDIGAEGPEEIAVSIIAELITLRRDRAGKHMRITPQSEGKKECGS